MQVQSEGVPMKAAIVILGLAFTVSRVCCAVGAETHSNKVVQCVPKAPTARLLQSANPNDIDPNWRGESRIGTSWTFIRDQTVQTDIAVYFVGQLVSPRGGVQKKPIFILPNEWNCE
jgi:hypothetical protein